MLLVNEDFHCFPEDFTCFFEGFLDLSKGSLKDFLRVSMDLPKGFLKDFIDFLKYLHGVPNISFKTITDFLKDAP